MKQSLIRDWVAESPASVTSRLDDARDVQKQIRFTIAAMAVVSTMIVVASYNAYVSFDRYWALEQRHRQFDENDRTGADVVSEQGLRNWADSRNIAVPLLGIRVNIDDAPVLGTLTLLVFALWLLLLERRENHIVGSLLRDTDDSAVDTTVSTRERWRIVHSAVSSSLFVNFDPGLGRIETLTPQDSSREGKVTPFVLQTIKGFFFAFPALACVWMFGLDRMSYFQQSAFSATSGSPGVNGFFWPSFWVFLFCWAALVVCSRNAWLYSASTEKVTREYRDKAFQQLARADEVLLVEQRDRPPQDRRSV